MKTSVIVLLILAVSVILISIFKSKNPVKNLISSAFQGIISMMAVNVIGLMTGVTIAVNWYTISAACIFGIPSSIAIILLDMFLI